jgi:hypothetical protein
MHFSLCKNSGRRLAWQMLRCLPAPLYRNHASSLQSGVILFKPSKAVVSILANGVGLSLLLFVTSLSTAAAAGDYFQT